MSMPSSSDEVATTAGSRPALRSSSTRARCSRDTEPWWARATTTSPAGCPESRLAHQLGRRATGGRWRRLAGALGGQLVEPGGEPLGQAAGVGEHDRRAVCLDQVEHPLLDVRPDRRRRWAPAAGPLRSSVGSPRADMSSTGTTTCRSNVFVDGGWTTVTGRPPARKVATSSTGRTVAERPMRWAGASSSRRRGVPATAPGGRRAWCRTPRAPRRRSRCRCRAAPRARRR